jgi:hypothetical protein
MFSRNWEDWAMAVPLAAAAVLALALSGARAPSFASVATAAEGASPQYVMTVTGNRLPAECKGLTGRVPAHCAALMNGTTVTVREVR